MKKFSWQEILGNCTLIVCIKRHSIPWAIELKFVFDLEKQVVIPFHSTIASSFWATTTLASSKNVTSNKMTNLKDSCICSCMQSLIPLWHGKQQMHLAMIICWSCFSSTFLLDWTHNQEKLCATSHAYSIAMNLLVLHQKRNMAWLNTWGFVKKNIWCVRHKLQCPLLHEVEIKEGSKPMLTGYWKKT